MIFCKQKKTNHTKIKIGLQKKNIKFVESTDHNKLIYCVATYYCVIPRQVSDIFEIHLRNP